MQIFFNASDIAALINKNPYKSQEEILHNILCKIQKIENKTDINKFKNIDNTATLKLLDVFKNNKDITDTQYEIYTDKLNTVKTTDDCLKLNKELLECVTKNCIKLNNTNDCIKQQKILEKKVDNILGEKNTKEIKEYMNGFINKKRGIRNENKIIEQYAKKYKTNVTNNNSKLYKYKLCSINDIDFYICGKIDGIENDELIEVKNRKNRLFTFIPEYEQIQIEIYFKLTNLNKGKLIQNYNDTQSIILIEQNNDLWNIIETELNIVANKLIDLL